MKRITNPPGLETRATDADEPDGDLVAMLRRYDEELRRGALDVSTAGDAISADTPADMDNVLDCLHLLERAWPRAGAESVPAHPERIGRFVIERTLGQGGFGIVYLATDPELKRQVALKVPRLHALAQPQLLERFRREARAAAGLDHPNIIPVYEAGEAGGVCYIASTYCPGPTLAQWLRDQPGGIAARMAATLVEQLADAVAYSHGRGVLHRDIKPGNVLLDVGRISESGRVNDQFVRKESDGLGKPSYDKDSDGFGNPSYDGFTPRLGDFGLAKIAQDALADGSLDGGPGTAASALLGTPSYMAPEQVGRDSEIGPAADVYALGAVLYELLTGRPPFQGPNVADVLDQVRHMEPVPVRRLRRDVPRDLETICLACLEKEPGRRYRGAADLRDDLKRFLAGEAIRARPPGWVGRTVKWVRRRPAAAGFVAVSVAAVVGMVVQQSLHSGALEDTNIELRRALRESLEMRYASDIRNAWTAYNEGDFAGFQRIIARYADGEALAEYRGPEWYYLDRLTRTEGRELTRMPQAVYMATVSPDGKTIAVVGKDAIVRIVNYATGEAVAEWATGQGEVNGATYSPDGKTIWTTGDDGTIRTWDVATHRERMQPINAHQAEAAFEVVFVADRELLISCGREGVIKMWDSRTGESRGLLEGHQKTVETIKLYPDGRRLVSASLDHTIRVWELTEHRLLRTFDSGPGGVKDVCISPDGRFLAACSEALSIWDIDDGVVLLQRQLPDMPARVCFAPNGDRLYVSSRAGVMHAFDLTRDINGRIVDSRRFAIWQVDTDRSYAQVCDDRRGSVITSGNDGRVVAWNSDGHTAGTVRDVECPSVWDFEFTLDSSRLYAAGGASDSEFTLHGAAANGANGVYLRNVETPADGGVELETSRIWRYVAVSPVATIAAAASDLQISLWTIPDHKPITEFAFQQEVSGSAPDLCFSHDGNTLIAWIDGAEQILFIEPHTGEVVDRYLVDTAHSPAASPRNTHIAFADGAHRVQLHDWRAKRILWESAALSDPPDEIAFSPAGDFVLASDPERVIYVWDVDSGTLLHELRGHFDRIDGVTVSPDGRTIAGAGEEGTLSLWHSATGQLLFTLTIEGYDARCQVCQFSPDGRWLAVIAGFHRIRLIRLG